MSFFPRVWWTPTHTLPPSSGFTTSAKLLINLVGREAHFVLHAPFMKCVPLCCTEPTLHRWVNKTHSLRSQSCTQELIFLYIPGISYTTCTVYALVSSDNGKCCLYCTAGWYLERPKDPTVSHNRVSFSINQPHLGHHVPSAISSWVFFLFFWTHLTFDWNACPFHVTHPFTSQDQLMPHFLPPSFSHFFLLDFCLSYSLYFLQVFSNRLINTEMWLPTIPVNRIWNFHFWTSSILQHTADTEFGSLSYINHILWWQKVFDAQGNTHDINYCKASLCLWRLLGG